MDSSQSGWETRLGKEQKLGESWDAESQTCCRAVLGRGGALRVVPGFLLSDT